MGKATPVTDAERKRVLELHAVGKGRNEIAAERGRSRRTISEIAKGAPVQGRHGRRVLRPESPRPPPVLLQPGRQPVPAAGLRRHPQAGIPGPLLPAVRPPDSTAGPAIPHHRAAAGDLPTCRRMRERCSSQRRRGRWDVSGTASRAAYGPRRSGAHSRGALVVLSESDDGRRDACRAPPAALRPFSPAVRRGYGSRQDRLRGRSARTPDHEARAGS